MNITPRARAISAAVITVLIWTSFIVVARAMALRSLTPFDIVLVRIVGAAIILLPWGWWLVHKQRETTPAAKNSFGLSPLSLKVTCLIGLFGGIGYAVLAYSAFTFAPAAHGSILLPGTLPLTTALLSVLVLKEKLTKQRLTGLAIILLGGLTVGGLSIWQGLQNGGTVWIGDLLFLSASTCWATYTILCRKHQLSAVPATIAVIVFCTVFYIPAYALFVGAGLLKSNLLIAPIGEVAFQLIWQGMGSVVISGITFTTMVQYFGPIRTTMITAIVPGLSALGAVVFLGEPLYWNLLLGLFLVTIGIVVGVRTKKVS